MELEDLHLAAVVDFLGSIPILQQLPAEVLKRFAEAVRPMRFAPGAKLVQAGEPGEGFYIIWQGQAEVHPPAEAEIVGNVLRRGDYFGSACPEHHREIHKADVTATDEVTCLVLTHDYYELVSSRSLWTGRLKDRVATVEQILELEKLDVDLFRGITLKPTIGRVFGGQLVGQALAAASKSVDPSLLVHSLHSYFLRVGQESIPVIYQVQRVRDGQRFATRQVTALQNGLQIFRLSASFQKAEQSLEHQDAMPAAPKPEEALPEEVLKQRYRVDARIPLTIRKNFEIGKDNVIDVRLCDPIDEVQPGKPEPRARVWMRSKHTLSNDQALHRCVAAYFSDYQLISVASRPHRSAKRGFQVLSLDHSLWFHRPFRADEWLLYALASPNASEGRGLAIGHFYTQAGMLVMTAVQEGVFRMYDRVPRKSKL